ncbi:type I pantothenate kinase [Halalkalibacterium ligniniphilum]|uniref:type I pantothenate kinase n=1 Tax=Halalkalibacterium ligniniphilum TaxID=1134413 RepID=UPI00034658AB|nr:type I pantothenate kinase [Halalkalibacterium ligniniphilum]
MIDTQNFFPYTTFSRKEWASLKEFPSFSITDKDLKDIQGVNEQISLSEVAEVYVPLAQLLHMHASAFQQLHQKTHLFFNKKTEKIPFVIGIAGSVSVGKSTTARLIQMLLSHWPAHPSVDLVTTDGFLYPNAFLEERGLMKRKGFPESYDIHKLIQFLADIKAGVPEVEVPVYSHLTYDVLSNQVQRINQPDIVIVEGINVLQVGKKDGLIPDVFVSDFFDFSIYVDAQEEDIMNWYIERFKVLRNTAFQQPQSYFHQFRHLSDDEAYAFAKDIWTTINKVNLEKNIRPTRHRADLILHKGKHHQVDEVKLRKI